MKSGPKYDNLFSINLASTSKQKVLDFIHEKFQNKEKFYILTPNPEIMLASKKDWLLRESLKKADLAVPDGIGIKFAYKLLHNKNINIIKGRELFMEILKYCDLQKLKVYFVGGENGENERAIKILCKKFSNIVFKTHHTPKYGFNGQPATHEDRRNHKKLMGSIKLFEPDMIFVGMTPPRQEKWIYRNFFRINTIGAMAIGGTFKYITGEMKLPPKIFEKLNIEWLWRLIQEPKRIKRILNAVVFFPLEVISHKFSK